ncbi:MAG: PspC domain-containing protein [Chloroflexi bacterium]|nr:PspC domain-containing protein [Chloroflexota bacterium]
MNRRLTRSRDAMIGGVAAGLANWIGADHALVRIAWALLVPLTGGAALLAYIVAWIVVPEEPPRSAAAPTLGDDGGGEASTPVAEDGERVDDGRTALLVGGGLVVVGLWFLVREYLPAINWGLIWPALLVVAGIVILVTASRRR